MFGVDFTSPHRYRHDSGWKLRKFSSGYMYKKIRKTKHVQCLTDFFIKVLADLKDQASLQSYDLAPYPPPSFPLYQSVMRPPSPLNIPRKEEKQYKNCPRSEEATTTGIKKIQAKTHPLPCFFAAQVPWFNQGAY